MLNKINTLFVGQVLHCLESVDSTNNYALNLVAKSKPIEGTAIFTDNQFQGKGQFGNVWQTEAGKNVTVSIIFRPTFLSVDKQFLLNQAVSIAIVETISTLTNKTVEIKWPNDILYNDEKVCGILIENNLASNKLQSAVIGIGINVNQTAFPAIIGNVSSLKLISNTTYDLGDVLGLLFERIEKWYLHLKQGKDNLIRIKYLEKMRWRGENHLFKSGTEEFEGEIIGVSPEGKLAIKTGNTIKHFAFKEVAYIE